MERTDSIWKSLTNRRTPRGGMKSGKLPMLLAGLALAGWLAPAAFGLQRPNANGNGNRNDKKYFKATITPAVVSAGSTTSFTLTITPCDTSAITTDCSQETQGNGNKIGSADIGFPAAFSVSGTPSVTAPAGKTWHAHTPSGAIQLRAGANHTGAGGEQDSPRGIGQRYVYCDGPRPGAVRGE